MISKQLLYIFIAVTTLAACSSKDRRFKVVGNIKGLPEQTVILEQLNPNDIITIVDSQSSTKDGHFELSGISPEPGLYRLHFHPNKFILLSIDKGNIKVEGTWGSLENYTVAGSASSENLKSFIVSLRKHLSDFNTMSMVLDSLQARGNDSILTVAKNDFRDMRQGFTQFVEHYADTTSFEPNAIFAARILNPATEVNYLNAFSQSLHRRYPNTKMTKEYTEYYAKITEKQKHPAKAESPANSAVAPEISLPDVTGKKITLSSFKGKYVLVDFWASWCQPCRAENPNVVAAYEKFKGRNFTILGISLDDRKEPWQKAISDDGLYWTQVSDLNGWSSAAAAAYGVHSIPANFLIDTAGNIIAHDLRGNQLEEMLEEVFKDK